MKFSFWHWSLAGAALVGLVAWQTVAAGRGALALPDSAATAAMSPLQRALRGGGDYLSDVGRVLVGRDALTAENARLQTELAQTQGRNARLENLQRENEELRALLKMPDLPGGQTLTAQVISADTSPLARRLTLNVGTRAGVAPKDVVYCPQGVVGQVTQVGALTCVVTLLIDREGAAGARVARSGAQGMVMGDGSRVAPLAYLPYSADVREGDVVITSGLSRDRGAIFPPGLVIGRIKSIEKNRVTSQQSALVEPSVPYESLAAVKVRVGAGAPRRIDFSAP